MGYVFLAAIMFLLVSAVMIILTATGFGSRKTEKTLKITIPENLDYEGLFDDLFEKYTLSHKLVKVKTSNMGTLYDLEYIITLKGAVPKSFIDDIRCRNGNLNIVCGRTGEKEAL